MPVATGSCEVSLRGFLAPGQLDLLTDLGVTDLGVTDLGVTDLGVTDLGVTPGEVAS